MKKIYSLVIAAAVAVSMTACMGSPSVAEQNKGYNVQVFVSDNKDGAISPKTIDAAFTAAGMVVDGDNNMNSPFMKRFKKIHYKTYNLAMFHSVELSKKLVAKDPKFAILLPLTMSIWSDDKKHTLNISCLSLEGMANATGFPVTDPDLVAYAALTKKALKAAMPNGHFIALNKIAKMSKKSFAQEYTLTVELDEDQVMDDYIDDFEAEFEGEMEPLGFLLPNYLNLNEELFDEGDATYDFFHTYSICKFDVIFPVSEKHPEAGAYAPCSFYIYKKKSEEKMHMGYLGVNNWIKSLNITEKEAFQPLLDAQGMINNILKELTED